MSREQRTIRLKEGARGDFAPDEKSIFVIGRADRVLEFDLESGAEISRFQSKKYSQAIKVSPDGRWVAIGTSNEEILLYTRLGELVQRWKLENEIHSLVWSKDSKRFVVAQHQHCVSIFNIENFTLSQGIEVGRVPEVNAIDDHFALLDWHLEEDLHPRIRVYDWDFNLVQQPKVFEPGPTSFGISPTGETLWFYNQSRLQFVASDTQAVLATLDIPKTESLSCCSISPTDRKAIVTLGDGSVVTFIFGSSELTEIGNTYFPQGSTFSPSGKWCAVFGAKGAVVIDQ